MTEKPQGFDYSAFPAGYYDQVIRKGHPVRAAWHLQKFRRVIQCLPTRTNQSILDIGCFAGTFLSLVTEQHFRRQVGVDILPTQIAYAQEHFGSAFRRFSLVDSLGRIEFEPQSFDCVTLIEVIEHLSRQEAAISLAKAARLLRPEGKLILTTPNYASLWPLIEIMINHWSDVSYEEQHITKFNFFTVMPALRRIYPELDRYFTVDFVTTTHFIAPFLALASPGISDRVSSAIDHRRWRFPFGNMILMSFTRSRTPEPEENTIIPGR